MSLNVIRKTCILCLPILLAVATAFYFGRDSLFSQQHTQWIEAFYTIALTANIGYFTNYIAIKMLFKPHYKTAFGRQGLIPKNQEKLAEKLSQTMMDNFLSSQQWREYLVNSKLISQILCDIRKGTSEWLDKQKNIELIEQSIALYLTQNSANINSALNQVQHKMVHKFVDDIEPQDLLKQGFEWLAFQFENEPVKMQQMIEPIIRTIAENIPDIAQGLANALDAHIEEQDTIKRGIAKMAKWSADFDNEDIKKYLFRLVASFEFRETLFNGLKSLVSDYKNQSILFSSTDSQNKTHSPINLQQLLKKLATEKLDKIDWANTLKEHLILAGNCQPLLKQFHQIAFDKIEEQINNGQLDDWLIDRLIAVIEKLDLKKLVKQKANQFTPAKMEYVFQSMISEQLVFIELLGAVLGALSGLALVDIKLFAGLTTTLLGYYLLDHWLTSKRERTANTTLESTESS